MVQDTIARTDKDLVRSYLNERSIEGDLFGGLPRIAEEHGPPVLLRLTLLFVLGLLFSSCIQVSKAKTTENNGTSGRTAKVEKKDFVRIVRLAGTTEAIQSYNVLAPRLPGRSGWGDLTITKLVVAGTRVKPGDLLVEFDRQGQIRNFLDTQREYLRQVEQIKKKKAEIAAAKAKDDTELKAAENDVASAKWEMQRNEVIARIDAEKNEQNYEEAKAKLQELRTTYNLKRLAAEAELRVLEIQSIHNKMVMTHAQNNMEKMMIRANMEGIVVLSQIWKGQNMGEVQEGDSIHPGSSILQLVNPSAMQVRARVNQADFLFMKMDQEAQISLDAYPGLMFKGRLRQVAPIGVPSSLSNRIRTFVALFDLEGSDPRMMPDLSAAIDVEIERIPAVLVAPRDAIFVENGVAKVRILKEDQAQIRAVTLAQKSDMEVVIESGVEVGDVLLLDHQSLNGNRS
jgi:HlyD family secretion protein